ncbi:MAG: hypothetical protein J6D28_00455 [Bacilli bacterium]|nr:hypothetical protein [Bacilli bacterium]
MCLTIKNTYISVHIFFYLFMFICLITGQIRDFLIFTSIIIVHECGHITGGILFGWKIKKIKLLPIGGLTIFNCDINTPLFEQFIVSILGPIFQIIFYIFINYLFDLPLRISYYNYTLLIFNLLPIFPLDGCKILNVLFLLIFPFKISHIICIIISFLTLGFMTLYVNSLLLLIMYLFLFIGVIKETINHRYLFNRFLFERYNNNYDLKKQKKINHINKMYLEYKHIFLINNKYYTEKNILEKRFDKNYKL